MNEYKELIDKKKYEEVLKAVDDECYYCSGVGCKDCGVYYVKKSVEKQIPKKPIKVEKDWGHIMFVDVGPICETAAPYSNFCPECGQAIDWSNDNE